MKIDRSKLARIPVVVALHIVLSTAAVAQSISSALPSTLAGLNAADTRFCLPKPVGAADTSTVSAAQLSHLRRAAKSAPPARAFSGLTPKYQEALNEALRVGPNAGYFAHRALRNLIILESIDQQINCPSGKECVQEENMGALKRFPTWSQNFDNWKSVRDTDLQRALVCMIYSKSLPTFDPEPVVAAVASNVPVSDDSGKTCDRGRVESLIGPLAIKFDRNSSRIGEQDLTALRQLAKALLPCPSLGIKVSGHTDRDGSSGFNKALSEARASSVAAELIKAGASPSQIETAGFGSSQPRGANRASAAKAASRRVEISVSG